MAHPNFHTKVITIVAATTALVLWGGGAACGNRSGSRGTSNRETGETSSTETSNKMPAANVAQRPNPEPKSGETTSVEPRVQSEIERAEAEKRATLLQDAQTALSEARNALVALDKGDKQTALAALSQASGKLDLVVTRDPHLALAPVGVDTVVYDLYATPDTVKTVVRQARGDLSDDRIQQARHELSYLASEADLRVAELPLASYPAAIKAVAPLIDQGRLDEAKAALEAALNSVVVETFVIPLPRVRADALLEQAQQITSKPGRTQADDQKARGLIAAARNEVQLAEALGYGSKGDYRPLYAEMDQLQRASEGGKALPAMFDRLRQSIRHFKFSS
jgi:hypothetical protein